jgi:hypothetical protein
MSSIYFLFEFAGNEVTHLNPCQLAFDISLVVPIKIEKLMFNPPMHFML